MDRVQVFEANYRTSHYLINLADSSFLPSERSQNKLANVKTAAAKPSFTSLIPLNSP